MSSDQTDWKIKINDLLNTCQNELKKTTLIGKKMLSATQANAKLHETYEEIGKLLKKDIEESKIVVENPKIESLLKQIKKLEDQLETFEGDVQDIKKG